MSQPPIPSANPTSDSGPPATPESLFRRFSWQRVRENAIQVSLAICALLSVGTTIAIICVLAGETIQFFRIASMAEFLTHPEWSPQFEGSADLHVGVRPLVVGTFMVAGIASLIGIPIGLACAIYLSEYASARFRNAVKPTLEMLAGIPTVVYGYFAFLYINPYTVQPVARAVHALAMSVCPGPWRDSVHTWLGSTADSSNAAAGGIAVGIMIIPMVASLSEDVLRAVPRGLREAAYGLGSTKFDVSVRVVVPAGLSGILASFLLAFSRAVGETMVVAIAAGQSPTGSFNPFRATETMTAYIANVASGEAAGGTLSYYSIYAVGALLFLITLATNMLAQVILKRYREVYH